MALVATVEHCLELALITSGDLASEQVAGPVSPTQQEAELDRAPEQRAQGRRLLEDDVGRQLDLGQAVAVAQAQSRAFGRAELGRQLRGPVVAALLEHGRRQGIVGGLTCLRL